MRYSASSRVRSAVVLLLACSLVLSGTAAALEPSVRVALTSFPDNPKAVYASSDIVRGADGSVWVADTGNNRVLRLTSAGELLDAWDSDGAGVRFSAPTAVALGSGGRVYVADTGNDRVVVIGSDGSVEAVFGSTGIATGQMRSPSGVAVDDLGRVYVADTANHRIQRFSATGTFQATYGSQGSTPGQFSSPKGICVSGLELYVADSGNRRIAVIGTDLSWSRSWGPYQQGDFTLSRYVTPSDVWVAGSVVYVADTGNSQIEACTTGGVQTTRWGTVGSGNGQFQRPGGIWADASTMWVADTGNNRLQLLTTGGVFIESWQASGSGANSLNTPRGVARDSAGNFYVADTLNNRVQKYGPSGTVLATIGSGTLSAPSGVAVDALGNVYVADTGNGAVRKFDAGGSLAGSFGVGVLNQPRGVALAADGRVLVADTGNHMVRIYEPGGSLALQWGGFGTGAAQFNSPSALAVTDNTVYVSDTGNSRISRFQIGTGVTAMGSWGGAGTLPGLFREPVGVAVSTDGSVWVCDSVNDRLQEFSANGEYRSSYGRTGAAPGEFHVPVGLAAGPSGMLIVAEAQACRVQVLALDAEPPVTTISGVPSYWAKDATLTLEATDDLAVASTRYRIGTGPALLYTQPITGIPEGETTVYFASVDRVGREETTKSATMLIDRTPPLTTSGIDDTWRRSPASVVLTRADGLSGVASTTYRLDSGSDQPYTGAFSVFGEGIRTLRFRSVDRVGNVEDEQLVTIRLDNTPPNTVSDATGLWRSTPETVTLTSGDALSGPSGITYRVGTTASVQYAGPFVVTNEGQTIITFAGTDMAGNREATQTAVVRIDRTPPVTQLQAADPLPDRTRFITLATSDAGSGVGAVYYSVNGINPRSYGGPFLIDASQPALVEYWSEDRLGNRESTGAVLVQWDYTAPATTATGLDGAWRSTAATVSLTATDAMSAIAETRYRIGDGTSSAYAAPFTVGTEGETTVTYWSVDSKGNAETPKSGVVRIDRTPPATLFSVGDPLPDETRLVTLAGSDTGAGMGQTQYFKNGSGPFTYSGPFAIESNIPVELQYWSTDALGNREATQTALVDDDFVPPVTISDMDGVWRSTPVTVTLDATDPMSGVLDTYYRVGGGAVTTYSATPFLVSDEGATRVTFWSVDNAGLREEDRTGWVRIDRTAPESHLLADVPFANRTRMISITAEDAGIGQTTSRYSINGQPVVDYAGPFLVDAAVPTVIEYSSSDGLGNREDTQTAVVEYDYVPPVTTANLDGEWRATPALVTLSASDVMSGVRTTYYRTGEGAITTYTVPFTVDAEGETKVTYWSDDNRANVEAGNEGWVRIDRMAPVSTCDVMLNPYGTSAIVTLDAEDVGGAGVGLIQYRLNSETSWRLYMGGFYLGTPGDTLIHFRATDTVANTEGVQTRTVTLRQLVPQTMSTIDGQWHGGDVTVHLSSSYEGTAPVSTYFRVGDTGTVVPYAEPFKVTAEGQTRVHYWSVADGVQEPTRTATVRIDRTRPVSTYSQVISANPPKVTVSLSATDPAGSGVAALQYRTGDAVAWQTYSGPFQVRDTSVVWFRAIDSVGNQESAQSRSIPPVTSANRSSTSWYRTNVSVSLTATHPAGVKPLTYYRMPGQSVATRYTGPFTVSSDGTHVITYWSVADGVAEPARTLSLHIDKTRPVINYLVSPTHPRSTTVYRSRNVRFKWTGYDRTSKVYGYSFKMDRSPYTNPSTARASAATTAYYTNRSSGTWYFHVRARDRAGNWGPTRHIRVRIR